MTNIYPPDYIYIQCTLTEVIAEITNKGLCDGIIGLSTSAYNTLSNTLNTISRVGGG